MCGSSDLDNFYIDDIRDEAELDKILHIEVGHSDAGDGRSLTSQQELEAKQETDGASETDENFKTSSRHDRSLNLNRYENLENT